MPQTARDLNSIAPLAIAQEFATPAIPWTSVFYGPCAVMQAIGGGSILEAVGECISAASTAITGTLLLTGVAVCASASTVNASSAYIQSSLAECIGLCDITVPSALLLQAVGISECVCTVASSSLFILTAIGALSGACSVTAYTVDNTIIYTPSMSYPKFRRKSSRKNTSVKKSIKI